MNAVNALSETSIASDDRGLMYGDGLFETIAVIDGQPRHWPEHWQRLQEGCRRLALPALDSDLLERECHQHAAGQQRAVLKLIVTRGRGGRGYRPPARAIIRHLWSLHPWPDYPASHSSDGVRVRICETRLATNPQLAGIKHLNRLEQVMARSEWQDETITEGLMLDQNGRLIEATSSNVLLIRNGRVYTSQLNECGVAGVMRERVLKTARELAIPVHQQPLTLQDLRRADELALCNSLFGLWPVAAIDGLNLDLRPPWPIVTKLSQQLQRQGDL